MSRGARRNLLLAVGRKEEADLPEGWATCALGNVLTVNYGKGLTESVRKTGAVPVYGSNGVVGAHDTSLAKGPAIIVGRKGTVGAVHLSPEPCWPIDTTYFIDEFAGLEPKFLLYLLRSIGLEELDTSSAIPGLNRDDLYSQELTIAPLPEQKRIVAKVEELLARVNAARERLAKRPRHPQTLPPIRPRRRLLRPTHRRLAGETRCWWRRSEETREGSQPSSRAMIPSADEDQRCPICLMAGRG